MTSPMIKRPSIVIRHAKQSDVDNISELIETVYPAMPRTTKASLKSLIKHFPEGQIIVLFDNKVVGYCATIRVVGDIALRAHTWDEITASGYGTTHDPEGDYLYGVEVCIHPEYRNHHLGYRIYEVRKKLCTKLGLKGIIICGRLARLAEKIQEVKTAEHYLDLVKQEKLIDKTLIFQLHNGFEIIGLLKNYLPDDKETLGYAAHAVWYNPEIDSNESEHQVKSCSKLTQYLEKEHIRVAAVQYKQRKIKSFEEFASHIEYFIEVVAEYETDFVLFPESFTMQLLSISNKPVPAEIAIAELATYTEQYKALMCRLAIDHNINIIGGSMATKDKNRLENVSYIFLRDGSIYTQAKIHPTPDERQVWKMKGASRVDRIMTDCGPIGVLICYDSEFPELARHLADQGVYIIFIPFCTDQRAGYLRVRYCAQARAIENQCYVVIAGNVGNLPDVHNMNVQYAQSCILTPCDFPFARDGIAADTSPNVETIVFADLNIRTLVKARNTGSRMNLSDRRDELYTLEWYEPEE